MCVLHIPAAGTHWCTRVKSEDYSHMKCDTMQAGRYLLRKVLPPSSVYERKTEEEWKLHRFKEKDISPEHTDRSKEKLEEYCPCKGSFLKVTVNVKILTLIELMAGWGKPPYCCVTISDSVHSSSVKMEATGSFSWYHISEDNNLRSHYYEKQKSHREIYTYRNHCILALLGDSCLYNCLTKTHRRDG